MSRGIMIFFILLLFWAAGVTAAELIFKAPVICPGGSYYYALAVADVDKDGNDDIITTDADDNNVTIFLTRADGTFSRPIVYDIQGASYTLAVADLSGDGYVDIVVGREIGYDDKLGILLNKGDGTFDPPVNYDIYNTPYGLTIVDVDGDGDQDVLSSTHNYVQMFRNQGNGTFDPAVDFTAAYNMNAGVAAADFDDDGDIDFAVNNYEFDSTQVFFNDGSGNFTSSGRYYSGHYPNSLNAIAINDDAYPDLVITNRTTGKITILMNDGDGTFAAPAQYTVGSDPQWADPADFNGDGDIDVAVATWTGKGISMLFNNGDGTFAPAVNYLFSECPSVASGDFDQDGDLDLALTPGGKSITVAYNAGDGSFPDVQKYAVGTKAWGVAIGDLDNNDNLDIAVTNFTSGTVTTLINNGDSTFSAGTMTDLPAGAGPAGIAMADLDGDMIDEMIIADFNKDSITVKDYAAAGATNYLAGDGPRCVVAGLIDGDAYPDVVVVNENTKSFLVYLNDGSGGLLTPAAYPTTNTPFAVAIADLDGDGDNDVAIANDGTYPGYHQRVFLNDGNGAFTPGPLLPISYWGNSVIAGDIDGDGDVDLVYGQDDSKVTVYKNNGSGAFPDSTGYEMPFTPSGFFVADFDLDGHDDLAVANKWDGYFAVMFNRGDGVFDRTGYFRLGDYGKSITGADLDGDGDIDLAAPTCTDHADSLRIFWNQKELIPAGIGDEPQKPLPNLFALRQNYPNPFNPSTTIEYSLSRAAEVTITIGNVLGQTVCTLEQEDQPAGQHRVIWNGKDAAGRTVASGVYFYRLKAGDFVRAKKMILLK